MTNGVDHKNMFIEKGFVVINNIYSELEIEKLGHTINKSDNCNETFRKTNELFAIRQFLKEVPEAINLIFNPNLISLIKSFGPDYFVSKSIYFDKPSTSNWFVAYHQDITISVDKRIDLEGFSSWTVKQNQLSVQPPLNYLKDNFTIRIHLDFTDEYNGALKVIPESHKKGIYRQVTIDRNKEVTCNVNRGGVMLMHPLLLHSSQRTVNNKKRRVIHIEFCNNDLPANLYWSEKIELFKVHETI